MRCTILILLALATQALLAADRSHSSSKQIIRVEDTEDRATTYTYTPPVNVPSINSPVSSTVWQHGDFPVTIEWDGLDGSLVMIELYSGEELVCELSRWIDNEGFYTRTAPVMQSWSSGVNYSVRVVDNLENELWSEIFQVASELLVTAPVSGITFVYGDYFGKVIWSGGSGSNVNIELHRNGEFVSDIYSGQPGDGAIVLTNEVSSSLGSGSGFRIKVTDPMTGFGYSGPFSIEPFAIESPSQGTYITTGEVFPEVKWRGGANLVKLSLFRGNTEIHQFSGWIDNSGHYTPNVRIAADWTAGNDYRLKIEDDLESVGWSDYFSIGYSDNVPEGAVEITGESIQGSIDSFGDIDYYSIEMYKDMEYVLKIRGSENTHAYLINSNNEQLLAINTGEESVYQCTESGKYYLFVRGSNDATGDYSFHVTRRSVEYWDNFFGFRIGAYLPGQISGYEHEYSFTVECFGEYLNIEASFQFALLGSVLDTVEVVPDDLIEKTDVSLMSLHAGYVILGSKQYHSNAGSIFSRLSLGIMYNPFTSIPSDEHSEQPNYRSVVENMPEIMSYVRGTVGYHQRNGSLFGLEAVLTNEMMITMGAVLFMNASLQ